MQKVLAELEKSAQPGFYGQVTIELLFQVKRRVTVHHEQSLNQRPYQRPYITPEMDTRARREMLEVAGANLVGHLDLMHGRKTIVAHYQNGALLRCEVEDTNA
jgi:hypothetical protein